MPDWREPRRSSWVETLDRAVRASPEPPTLIAHSLGCIAIAHWAANSNAPVRGALLVAPADVDRAGLPIHLANFHPVPRGRLRFRTHVVASDNDPYAALYRVRELARSWGSALTVLPGARHINTEAGYGPWTDGLALLRALEPAPADADVHDRGMR